MISATIRLHQVKYFDKTGIPPVDRGMLMFYNMGQLDKIQKENSIFNEVDAARYLVNFDKYPLHLDVALPVFSWAAVYRNSKLKFLISDFEPSLLGNANLSQINKKTYLVKKLIEMKTYTVRPGDVIKFEIMNPGSTRKAAELIQPYIKDSVNVILFDYNNLNLKRYDQDDLEDIYHIFD